MAFLPGHTAAEYSSTRSPVIDLLESTSVRNLTGQVTTSSNLPVSKGTYYDLHQGIFEDKLVRFFPTVSGIYYLATI